MEEDLPKAGGRRDVVRMHVAHTLRACAPEPATKGGWKSSTRDKLSLDCAQWAFVLQDDVVNWRYQEAIQRALRPWNPLRTTVRSGAEVNRRPTSIRKSRKASEFLTKYTIECMDRAEKYWDLDFSSIAKYEQPLSALSGLGSAPFCGRFLTRERRSCE